MGSSVMGAFGRAIDPTGEIAFKDPKPPNPTVPGPAPTAANAAVQAAKADSISRARRSMLKLNPTGGAGDLASTPTGRKTLLGQA